MIDDGWEIASIFDVDIDTTNIITMMNGILSYKEQEIHSIITVRHNTLVFEEYFIG